MKSSLCHAGLALCVAATSLPAQATEVKVLKKVPSEKYPCITATFRTETEIKVPFEKLCLLSDSWTALFFPKEDATGRALAKVKKAACECGANALIVLSNSSDDGKSPDVLIQHEGASRKRQREDVDAVAIRLQAEPSGSAANTSTWAECRLKSGFRDLTWGSAPKPEMTVISEKSNKDVSVYRRPTDKLGLGEIPLLTLEYRYAGERLFAVEMSAMPSDLAKIREFLLQGWGPPTNSGARNEWYWMCTPAGGRATAAQLDPDWATAGTRVVRVEVLDEIVAEDVWRKAKAPSPDL